MASTLHHQTIKDALTAARMSTYEAATAATPQLAGALALYAWNAQVSAALMAPLHICEVVIRNAVADALAGSTARTGHGNKCSSQACRTRRGATTPGLTY